MGRGMWGEWEVGEGEVGEVGSIDGWMDRWMN